MSFRLQSVSRAQREYRGASRLGVGANTDIGARVPLLLVSVLDVSLHLGAKSQPIRVKGALQLLIPLWVDSLSSGT